MDKLKRRCKQLSLVKEERDLALEWLGDMLDLLTIKVLDNPNHGNMERNAKLCAKYGIETDEEIIEKGWEIYNEISAWKTC